METTAVKTMPGIIEPDMKVTQDFSQPITFRWDPGKIPDKDVKGWWLCVGTLDVEEGDWDILSGDMRLNKHLTIDVSDQPHLKGLRVQLLCTVKDNDLDPPERTMVLDPIVFVSHKYRSVVEALAIIADEKKNKKKEVVGHHPIT